MVLPCLFIKRLIRNNLIIDLTNVIEHIILGIARIIEFERESANGSITHFGKDRLCIRAHIMPHIEGVGGIIKHRDGMIERESIGAHELGLESQSSDDITAPVDAHQIRYGIVLGIALFQASKLKLIHECRGIDMKVIHWANANRTKHLRVLVFALEPLGKEMVERLIKRYRDEVSPLRILFGIYNGVSKRKFELLERTEREHIRCHIFIGRTIMNHVFTFFGMFDIVTCRVQHI